MGEIKKMKVFLCFLLVVCLLTFTSAVDHSKFKTCSQSSFCARNRASASKTSAYQLQADSIQIVSKTHLIGKLKNVEFPKLKELEVQVGILKNGVVELDVVEVDPVHPRFKVKDVIVPEAEKPLDEGQVSGFSIVSSKKEVVATYVLDGNTFAIHMSVDSSFVVELYVNGQRAMSANSRGLLSYEEYRKERRPAPTPPAPITNEDGSITTPEAPAEPHDFPYDREGMWDESFGGNTDSKPRGPSAISLDVTFDGSEHLYGLPEHATAFALKNTVGATDPYRLYNLDVFEYILDSPMALYGAIPFVMSHSVDKTVGMLWLNAAETWVDVNSDTENGRPTKWTHFISESGIIQVFFFLGPKPAQVFYQYSELTGAAAIPQMFAIAYHQCRWNYKDEKDVATVDLGFDENDIPYDVLWLDIEHTDGKRYFTWDRSLFPNPKAMQQSLALKGRKMVTIVDPHMKRDTNYRVHNEATQQSLYIKNAQNSDYDGWCWPGSVSYIDFQEPKARDFWAAQFSYENYAESTPSLYTWNDMNEPSVFNGPEVTMPKDNLHLNNFEHRDVHNLYGYYLHMASHNAQFRRSGGNDRPFVLSRAFFAGSQRYGPIWTGDNTATWGHLASSLPMLLSLNIAGYSFVGADVGGFFGNPDTELLVRWYQAGAFQPFFRGHAHIDTKRREPWLFGDEVTGMIRSAIRARYAMLPYLYTVFYLNTKTGSPVMKPIWSQYTDDMHSFGMENQYLLGSDLLIHPITQSGQSEAHVYLPGNESWYDIESWKSYSGKQTVSIPAPLHKIPVFQRAGSVVTRKERVRRSTALMEFDPFTIVIAVDSKGSASGQLYLDDGRSYDHLKGNFAVREFSISGSTIHGTAASCLYGTALQSKCVKIEKTSWKTPQVIERIVIVGFTNSVKQATLLMDGHKVELQFSVDERNRLVIRKPEIPITNDFTITLA